MNCHIKSIVEKYIDIKVIRKISNEKDYVEYKGTVYTIIDNVLYIDGNYAKKQCFCLYKKDFVLYTLDRFEIKEYNLELDRYLKKTTDTKHSLINDPKARMAVSVHNAIFVLNGCVLTIHGPTTKSITKIIGLSNEKIISIRTGGMLTFYDINTLVKCGEMVFKGFFNQITNDMAIIDGKICKI